ncbi:uncharacterized protein LOC122724347 [Manihot esculenta]|uniref:uncharacterized protein LOC122724347 n=1 Tax=Manihot esculenta TaxID=3983 RepID=UPI001CC6D2EE|nr:uncharacterized protein LOC122724347 [Manihot esculenta]
MDKLPSTSTPSRGPTGPFSRKTSTLTPQHLLHMGPAKATLMQPTFTSRGQITWPAFAISRTYSRAFITHSLTRGPNFQFSTILQLYLKSSSVDGKGQSLQFSSVRQFPQGALHESNFRSENRDTLPFDPEIECTLRRLRKQAAEASSEATEFYQQAAPMAEHNPQDAAPNGLAVQNQIVQENPAVRPQAQRERTMRELATPIGDYAPLCITYPPLTVPFELKSENGVKGQFGENAPKTALLEQKRASL